jgi:hypothetical protein
MCANVSAKQRCGAGPRCRIRAPKIGHCSGFSAGKSTVAMGFSHCCRPFYFSVPLGRPAFLSVRKYVFTSRFLSDGVVVKSDFFFRPKYGKLSRSAVRSFRYPSAARSVCANFVKSVRVPPLMVGNGLAMISAWNRPQDYSAEKSS